MSLADEAAEQDQAEREGRLQADLAEVRRERDRLKRQLGKEREQRSEAETRLDMVLSVTEDSVPNPPDWTSEPTVPSGRKHAGTPVLMLTDMHYGEVVQPSQIFGLNAYNNDIAEQRTRRAFEGVVKVAKDYLGAYYRYDGVVVTCLGDLVTGIIHEELARTNEEPVSVTVDRATEWLMAGIRLLRDAFGKVHFAGVVGNHDRMGKRVPSKYRAQDSWTWVVYSNLVREFRRHTTVTFTIPEAAHGAVKVYDTNFLLLHGNDDRGGSGISGAFAPVFRGDYKRTMRGVAAARSTGNPDMVHDISLMGHWHQRIITPSFIVGNCLKGYDEYAFTNGFAYSDAAQEMLVVTPERGITFSTPIWIQDREAEGW